MFLVVSSEVAPTAGDAPQRLFLAVWPPPPVVAALSRLPRSDDGGVRWIAPENYHTTLRFLGPAVAADVVAAVDRVLPPRPAHVVLGPQVTTLGSAVVVPAQGLHPVASDLRSVTRHLGVDDGGRPFHGHLTLGRLRRGTRSCDLLGHEIELGFRLDAVVLISSEQTDQGSRYTRLRTWSVTDRDNG